MPEHQIKDYAVIGGLMLHAKRGSDTLSAAGVRGRQAKLRQQCRDEIDPNHQLDDVEFERRWGLWKSAYYRKMAMMRGGPQALSRARKRALTDDPQD